jgi:hypothetical protein
MAQDGQMPENDTPVANQSAPLIHESFDDVSCGFDIKLEYTTTRSVEDRVENLECRRACLVQDTVGPGSHGRGLGVRAAIR